MYKSSKKYFIEIFVLLDYFWVPLLKIAFPLHLHNSVWQKLRPLYIQVVPPSFVRLSESILVYSCDSRISPVPFPPTRVVPNVGCSRFYATYFAPSFFGKLLSFDFWSDTILYILLHTVKTCDI